MEKSYIKQADDVISKLLADVEELKIKAKEDLSNILVGKVAICTNDEEERHYINDVDIYIENKYEKIKARWEVETMSGLLMSIWIDKIVDCK